MEYKEFYEEPPNLDGLIEALEDPHCPVDVVVDVLTEKISWYDWMGENGYADAYPYCIIVTACLANRQLSGNHLSRAVQWFLENFEISLEESGCQFNGEMLDEHGINDLFEQEELSAKQLDEIARMLIRSDDAYFESFKSSETLGGPPPDEVFGQIVAHLNTSEKTKAMVKKFLMTRNEKGYPYQ
jgi:hypothetical protein